MKRARTFRKFLILPIAILLTTIFSVQALAYVELTWWNPSTDVYATLTLDGVNNGYLSSTDGVIRYTVQNQNGTKDTYTNRNNGSNPTADDIKLETGTVTFSESGWEYCKNVYDTDGITYTTTTVNGTDAFFFQELLNKAKGADNLLIMEFSDGTYNTNGPFRIYSYSTLQAASNTSPILKKNSMEYYFINADDSDADILGYNGTYGVHIDGLIFEMDCLTGNALKFTHANFYTVTNCVFRNGRIGHTIELNAMKNTTIDHCIFNDIIYSKEDGVRLTYKNMKSLCNGSYNHEVIQIEGDSSQRHAALSSKFGRTITVGQNSFPTIPLSYDNTVSTTVTVKNCEFTNVLRGIGHHYFNSENGGVYQTNVKILNNTFENVLHHAVFCRDTKMLIFQTIGSIKSVLHH